MSPTTTTAVIPAAVSTIEDLVVAQITPTSRANTMVKTSMMGNPNFLTTSTQQEITMDMAISKTERMITTGLFKKIFLNV